MRKFTKIMILALAICMLFILKVKAAEPKVLISPSKEEIKTGEIFTIDIKVNCTEGFQGLTGELKYDKTKLEKLEEKNANGISNMNTTDAEGNYIVTLLLSDNSTTIKNGTVQTIKFKVLDKAEIEDALAIELKDISLKDGENKVNESQSTSVKVIEAIKENDNEQEQKIEKEQTPKVEEPKKEDNTTAGKSIDKAGIESYIVPITIISLLSIISFIKLRTYKNI